MKLYLLRHAERGHGKKQDSLTKNGIEQSKKIASFLEKLNINKIICADTKRARNTIKLLEDKFSGKIFYTKLVNEQEMGVLAGKSGEEYRKALENSGLDKKSFRPENGENYYDMVERAKKFRKMLKKEKSKNILVSTHAGFIRTLVKLLRIPDENSKFDYASISIIKFNRFGKPARYHLNSKKHLL
ncbi:histidine phosphatase family protein [Candidatus Pacearchaeota archaeon]|nr:histidine phosphatase family protein [Candidatus Pacearchaeota archaeon]